MIKDTTYKDKMAILKPWMPSIVDEIKRDLKNDHLKKDSNFTKKHFQSKNLNKLTASELAEGYLSALEQEEAAESIGEFISNRWLLKNSDVYYHFEKKLSTLTVDFSELTELEPAFAKDLVGSSVETFGALKTYVFSVFNSVVFPEDIFRDLDMQARKEVEDSKAMQIKEHEELSWQAKEKSFEQQIARLTEKYEKRLQGLERKYDNDTKMLKKQIANLHQKLTQVK